MITTYEISNLPPTVFWGVIGAQIRLAERQRVLGLNWLTTWANLRRLVDAVNGRP